MSSSQTVTGNDADLRVKIPARFRDKLSMRFDPSRAVLEQNGRYWRIQTACPLCDEYRIPVDRGFHYQCSSDCPFIRIQSNCLRWLSIRIGYSSVIIGVHLEPDMVWWSARDDAKARLWFDKIRKDAERWIEWIEE